MRTERIAALLLTALLIPSLAAASDSAAAPTGRMLVLGLRLGADLPKDVTSQARVLENVLGASLSRYSDLAVVGWADVMAKAEAGMRQQLQGCDSESCMTELAQMMDVDELVRIQLNRVDGVLVLDSARLGRSGLTVLSRASVRARAMPNLLASVDQMARQLLGGLKFSVEDPRLAERLGTNAEGVARVRARAASQEESDLSTVWTDLVVESNQESWKLPVLEGGLIAAAGAAVALGVVGGAYLLVAHRIGLGLRYGPTEVAGQSEWSYRNKDGSLSYPWMGVVFLLVHGVVTFSAVTALLGGALGVAVYDRMDKGRLAAHIRACCRDEARVRAAAKPTIPERAAPLLALAGGALAVTAPFTLMAVVTPVILLLTALPLFILLDANVLGGTGMTVDARTYRALDAGVAAGTVAALLVSSLGFGLVSLAGAGSLVARQGGDLLDDAAVHGTPRAKGE